MLMEESEGSAKEDFDIIYGPGDWIDVTDRIEEYEKGKTFTCDCGQGIGVTHDTGTVKCASCGLPCIDLDVDGRSPPEREEGQASLMDF